MSRTWPTMAKQWAERAAPGVSNALRLTTASVVSYLLTVWLTEGPVDLTGALTTLLVMQVSAVGSFRMGLVRVGAVVTGVVIALGISSFAGLTWWSLFLVIFLALVAGQLFRLGEQALETPISAMLILGSVGVDVAAETRILTTLIGSIVGIIFPLIFPPALPTRSAANAVKQVAFDIAAVFERAGQAFGQERLTSRDFDDWVQESRRVSARVGDASDRIAELADTRRLNTRAAGTADVVPILSSGLDTLERCLLASRTLFLVVSGVMADEESKRRAAGLPIEDADPLGAELQQAFGVVLDDIGRCIASFGELVDSEATGDVADADQRFTESLTLLNETQAIMTELMTTSSSGQSRWLFDTSVLAAVNQILQYLDFEARLRRRSEWHESQFGLRTPAGKTIGPALNPVSRRWVRRRLYRLGDDGIEVPVQEFRDDESPTELMAVLPHSEGSHSVSTPIDLFGPAGENVTREVLDRDQLLDYDEIFRQSSSDTRRVRRNNN